MAETFRPVTMSPSGAVLENFQGVPAVHSSHRLEMLRSALREDGSMVLEAHRHIKIGRDHPRFRDGNEWVVRDLRDEGWIIADDVEMR